ncbi:MAG: 16S rRNA (uracil(1498)-N(3))-methyltransferase [Verrucomicrobiae bacterium]|nr:16S rRNA (uracil(1498)-N(3))-methyltransferase [Verrucomicrobiae bacterium]
MNLILFKPEEIERPLPSNDPRWKHIREVLKVKVGESFDVGQIQGLRGKAQLKEVGRGELKLEFSWLEETPPLFPINLWVSFCRPQTCRRILQECTSLGVKHIRFFDTEKCEPAYRQSKLWTTDEWQRLLIRGAEQAFCTRLPEVKLATSLEKELMVQPDPGLRIALDNYEGVKSLGHLSNPTSEITLALGGERGWSNQERERLSEAGFTLMDLGPRVLRTDTACIAAISIIRHQLIF